MLENFTKLINSLVSILGGGVATLLMTVAFIAFLLAVINYIWKRRQGDAGGLAQAGNLLFGSVFGLFVMVSVWGLVNFIGSNILGTDFNKKSIERPQTVFNGTSPVSTGSTPSGLSACTTFTNNACPMSYCKIDSVQQTCVSKDGTNSGPNI
jgi:uncharacterized BrkB/YihY/UPF0761 family membrane protein